MTAQFLTAAGPGASGAATVTAVKARRILVYGVTGSGKSMLAARLGQAVGVPWTSVDNLTWRPGWQQVPVQEQRALVEGICAGESWLLDTAYGTWLEVPLARADVVVGLDYPRAVSFGRLLRRTATRMVDRKPICNGNTETLRQALSRDSILLWHVRSFAHKRRRIRGWLADPHAPPVVHLRSPRQAERWLAEVAAAGAVEVPARARRPRTR